MEEDHTSQLSEGGLRQAQSSVNRSGAIKARLQTTLQEKALDEGKHVAVKNFRVQNILDMIILWLTLSVNPFLNGCWYVF